MAEPFNLALLGAGFSRFCEPFIDLNFLMFFGNPIFAAWESEAEPDSAVLGWLLCELDDDSLWTLGASFGVGMTKRQPLHLTWALVKLVIKCLISLIKPPDVNSCSTPSMMGPEFQMSPLCEERYSHIL